MGTNKMAMSELERIIIQAYELYMPQDRDEITALVEFIKWEHSLNKEDYTILEIGTKYGGTFWIWNSINPNGLNISIDMSDGGLHGGISEEAMDNRDRHFRRVFDNVIFIRGNSHDEKTLLNLRYFSTVNFCKPWVDPPNWADHTNKPFIDFLFIDGDHTYEGVKQDFEMYSPLVKPGGVIAFHDINDTQRHRDRNVYVGKFWKELTESGQYETKEFNSNLDWAGIGVIIK